MPSSPCGRGGLDRIGRMGSAPPNDLPRPPLPPLHRPRRGSDSAGRRVWASTGVGITHPFGRGGGSALASSVMLWQKLTGIQEQLAAAVGRLGALAIEAAPRPPGGRSSPRNVCPAFGGRSPREVRWRYQRSQRKS